MRIPIIGFFHICMVNHYFEIISEQLKIMVESGLYDASEIIYVGCVGEEKEFDKVKQLFGSHSKIKVFAYNQDITEYEFLTLKILKSKSDTDKDFYGFYIHSKGISWNKEKNEKASIGGTYWRDSMNFYTLKKWRENIKELDKGYETCGTQIRAKTEAIGMHYSGNYYWFKSEYVKRVKPIEMVNRKDRHQAEFWLCSANPIAATMNQDFIDYNTQKVWKDPQ